MKKITKKTSGETRPQENKVVEKKIKSDTRRRRLVKIDSRNFCIQYFAGYKTSTGEETWEPESYFGDIRNAFPFAVRLCYPDTVGPVMMADINKAFEDANALLMSYLKDLAAQLPEGVYIDAKGHIQLEKPGEVVDKMTFEEVK